MTSNTKSVHFAFEGLEDLYGTKKLENVDQTNAYWIQKAWIEAGRPPLP